MAYEDNTSRFVAVHGVYPTLKSRFSMVVLDRVIREHGEPKSIPSDHGSNSYVVPPREKKSPYGV